MVLSKNWRLIILKDLDPIRLQAIYHALALSTSRNSKSNIVILTTTNETSISCGFHQNLYQEVDLDYCKKNDIKLIRRMAGGGLVLLDREQVFYNVILAGMGFPSPVKNLYKVSLDGPNSFLRSLNLDSNIDFNEISIGNRKISGTGAASIEKSGIVAGNIILDFNFEMFCNALNVPNEQFRQLLKEKIEKYMTTLKIELDYSILIDEIIIGLKNSFKETLNYELEEGQLSETEIEILEDVENQYKQENWNFRKRDDKDEIRTYLKIKKNACLVHYSPFKANFLISDEKIKEIQGSFRNKNQYKLIGKNIYKLDELSQDFKHLQEFLTKNFERSKI